MRFKKSLDYLAVIKYLVIFFGFFILSNIQEEKNLYSVSLFISAIFSGSNFYITAVLNFISLLLTDNKGIIVPALCVYAVFFILYLIYKKYLKEMKFELIAYTLLSLIPFIFLGNANFFIDYTDRVIESLFITVLTLFLFKFIKTVSEKGLKKKFNYEEYLVTAFIVIIFGVGVSSFLSPLVFKSIAVFLILSISFVFRLGIASLCSSILGLSLSVYFNDITYMAIFLLLAVSAESFMPLSRFLSASTIVITDYIIYFFFNSYGAYTLSDFFAVAVPSLIFSVIPTFVFENLKEKLYLFREKQLTRQTINNSRVMLANKLYNLSGVFTEIASTFTEYTKQGLSEEKVKGAMLSELKETVCSACKGKSACRDFENKDLTFIKLIEIVLAKGKLTLIDFPKEICNNCIHANDILFALNKMNSEYRKYIVEEMNVNVGRNLLREETLGISEVLKGLAFESGTLLKYQNALERELFKELSGNGVLIQELLIYGEGKNTSVSMVVLSSDFSVPLIEKLLKKVLKIDMSILDKSEINEEKTYISFKVSAPFDAVFGLSFDIKKNSEKSGDTHTVTRLENDKFLVALSDGMGSGLDAEKVSGTSLSLIETFYKAGLNDNLILTTINKLLAVNVEDSFTALDVAVIDLKNCSCDFIKYGAPYGFIINSDGIKIVEGNTLPLGILDNLSPSVAHTNLNDGDMILLCTDGVSDAFGSSGDILDFIRNLPALNPQSLADELINKAKELNGGINQDDMTCLAVRVFRKVI